MASSHQAMGSASPGPSAVTPGLAGAAGRATRPLQGGPVGLTHSMEERGAFPFCPLFPEAGISKEGALKGGILRWNPSLGRKQASWGWGWAGNLSNDAVLTSSLGSLLPVHTCSSAPGHSQDPSSTRRASGSAGELERQAALNHLGSDPGFLIHKRCDLQQVP